MSAGMQFVATSPNNPAGNERAVVSLLRHITGSAVLSALTLTRNGAALAQGGDFGANTANQRLQSLYRRGGRGIQTTPCTANCC